MHIPDGFISPLVAATTGGLSAGAIAFCITTASYLN
jgi:ABC-type Co2+ transport system permease subunit